MTTARELGSRQVRLMRADITQLSVDAIVNAANERLARGGGVCGAIHRAGGPEIERECAVIGHCATGEAVATGAGRLPSKHVIHAVAPIWQGGSHGEPDLLAGAYQSSLEVAERIGARVVAFPSLGTGIYGYPVGQAADVALGTVLSFLANQANSVEEVTFALFSDSDLDTYSAALERASPT